MKLTDAQKEIINYDQLGTLIVKGTAGSGKSLVGLHRINYLFNKRSTSLFANEIPCKVLVITFNKVMYYQLEQNFKNICSDNIKKEDVCFINIDKIIYKESKEFAISCGYSLLMNSKIIKENYIRLLNTRKEKFTDEFILDEFRWIRNNLLNKKQEYLESIRLGRGKKKLNKEDREYIWMLLQNYRERLKIERKIDYLDACILTLKRSELNLFSMYNHIIVDEAQDLSKLKLSFIVKLNNNNLNKLENSLLILYDSSQNVYDESWLGYGRSFSSIGLDVRRRIKKLEISYRTTRQIHQAANNLLSYYKEENSDKESKINPVFAGTEEGIKPIIFKFKDREDELKTISILIEKLTEKIYTPKDIMIVAFTNNDLYEIERFLNGQIIDKNGEKKRRAYILDGDIVESTKVVYNSNNFLEKDYDISEIQERCVKILTVNNAKGLESKVVFIAGVESLSNVLNNGEKDENEINIRNTKRLYTAMTRAQELLFISEDEEYIGKIDEKYLIKIKDYQNLDINSYLSAELEENRILIETNRTNRYENIINEYKKQTEEYKKLNEEYEIKLKKELEKNKKAKKQAKELKEALELEKLSKEFETQKKIENEEELEEIKKEQQNTKEYIKKLEIILKKQKNVVEILKDKDAELKFKIMKGFYEIKEKYLDLIIEAEILYSSFEIGSIGPEMVYVAYAKILENMLRDFLMELEQGYNSEATLGALISHIRKFKELGGVCQDLDSLRFISTRNNGAHNIIQDKEQLKKLRNYLIERKNILKIYQIIINKLNEKKGTIVSRISKFGELTKGTGTLKIKTIKTIIYYPYLIDNDDLAVSKKEIPNGIYKMEGHYLFYQGQQIYVIDEYKK